MYAKTLFQLPVLGICAIAIASCSSNSESLPPTPSLTWASCTDNDQVECATLAVPRDYQDTSAGNIELAIRRVPAPAATRQGALFVHLGGQGAAADGVDDLIDPDPNGYATPDELLAQYDLIGFDPRGSGRSTPIECTTLNPAEFNSYPRTDEDFLNYEAQATQVARDCFDKHGDFLLNLGSAAAVQDMDQIRQALGEEKINFLAVSFGTRMASLYLQTFPEHSGRFVLDAPLTPDPSLRLAGTLQLSQIQMNLETLLNNCALVDPDCDPETLISEASTRMDTLIAEQANREFDLYLALLFFATDLSQAGGVIGPLVDYLQDRNLALLEADIGPFVEEADIGPNGAIELAVLCADDSARPDSNQLISDLAELNQISNVYAELTMGWPISSCTGWPQATNPVAPITTNTAPQSLVIGGTTDQSTPIQGARETAAALGGYLIESEHAGHDTVYSIGNDCVDSVVTEFLLTGNLPTITRCPFPE